MESPMYRELGVSIDNTWLDNPSGNLAEQEHNEEEDVPSTTNEEQQDQQEEEHIEAITLDDDNSDNASEEELDEELMNAGVQETLLTGDAGIRIAPGTCLRPSDGNGRPLSYVEITKSLARRSDRRADFTVGDALNDNTINTLISKYSAYKVFTGIRSSGEYWSQEKKKILSMFWQFGIPTLFVTLSAAETQWPELLKILASIVDGQELTNDEIAQMHYNEKARLTQSDPVICVRYFDKHFRELLKTWKAVDGPFGKYLPVHRYHRIEFQQRGSPHAHMLLWLRNAPRFDVDDDDAIARFIDTLITCNTSDYGNDPEIQHKGCYSRIRSYLEDIQNNAVPNMAFPEFLVINNVDIDQYLLAIRSSLTNPKVFLKRDVTDIYINPFNTKILQLHRANMDIQFILDPYACCTYIVDYINKADRGLSETIDRIFQEHSQNNTSISQMLRALTNAQYNTSEVSA
ncbi:hypothetical protein INT45_012703 [Circinella minor]|uniref:Helitron helicase-like domain-containing protein n=1 Tax=Circinella minor TaxID=1195481 RepID=A0A8H7RSY0_9FUNG|nr:hypothetical protein INT45_012703 [Circinella minor]